MKTVQEPQIQGGLWLYLCEEHHGQPTLAQIPYKTPKERQYGLKSIIQICPIIGTPNPTLANAAITTLKLFIHVLDWES